MENLKTKAGRREHRVKQYWILMRPLWSEMIGSFTLCSVLLVVACRFFILAGFVDEAQEQRFQ